jgi:isoleucyl-tRNA synthetase
MYSNCNIRWNSPRCCCPNNKTTTPWTIPSNVAITVHPELKYGQYNVDGQKYIVAEALSDAVAEALGLDGIVQGVVVQIINLASESTTPLSSFTSNAT